MFARLLFTILGTLFLLVGILGVVLPLLPATPFLLLASACYVRGSQALHSWLMSHKYLGTYITSIQEHRGMPLKVKIVTIAALWASLLFSMYRTELGCLKMVSRARFSCPGFGPRSRPTAQYLGQLIGFSA
jgi:uncharacterized protein